MERQRDRQKEREKERQKERKKEPGNQKLLEFDRLYGRKEWSV